MKQTKKRVVLIVLDGWGISKNERGNAILAAHADYFNQLQKNYPHCTLKASGEFVGLKKGFIGNSEVGHLHIGAGRLVKQDLVRISDSIDDGSFFRNKVLLNAMKTKGALHLLGLLSDAGVHSHIEHLFALLEMAKKNKVKQVFVHAITDGRDTPPKSALKYLRKLRNELKLHNENWSIATIIGRYYAMDRDNRWNREHKAYEAMVNCKGHHHKNAETAVLEAYNRGETDEFIYPTIVGEKSCNIEEFEKQSRISQTPHKSTLNIEAKEDYSKPSVKEGDGIIFFNFRSDRARELTRAFVQGKFNNFRRKRIVDLKFTCLTQYDAKIKAPVAFAPEYLRNTFGEVLSKNGLKQFRLAETEKWAHVTYFFNGLSGRIFRNEDRLLIPSPKIRTYDSKPEMSAFKISNKAEELLNSKKHDFILINFANPDMVGHTGNFDATVKAVRTTDKCLSKLVPVAKKNDYTVLITADHGNAEQKLYPDGSVCTAHTTNDVPFILISENKNLKLKNGALYNIAPTILKIMNIKKPREMGEGLFN